MCEGASKQSSDLKNYTTSPGSLIPGSATDMYNINITVNLYII